MDRLVELLKISFETSAPAPEVFIAGLGQRAGDESIVIADRLREKGIWVEVGDSGSSLKSQMRRADRLAAKYVFILGEEEREAGKVKWKRLDDSTSGEISISGIADFILK